MVPLYARVCAMGPGGRRPKNMHGRREGRGPTLRKFAQSRGRRASRCRAQGQAEPAGGGRPGPGPPRCVGRRDRRGAHYTGYAPLRARTREASTRGRQPNSAHGGRGAGDRGWGRPPIRAARHSAVWGRAGAPGPTSWAASLSGRRDRGPCGLGAGIAGGRGLVGRRGPAGRDRAPGSPQGRRVAARRSEAGDRRPGGQTAPWRPVWRSPGRPGAVGHPRYRGPGRAGRHPAAGHGPA